jgi:hypothetical protein
MFLFRWIRNLVLLLVILIVLLFVVIVFLPKDYHGEVGIDIRSSRKEVFAKAQELSRWHLAAMFNGIDFDTMDIPMNIQSQIPVPGVNVDSVLSDIRDAAQSLKMKIKMVDSEFPSRVVYVVEGGPMNGMKPEILLYELNESHTKVAIKETFRFPGLLGGIKAFSVRFGMNKLNMTSLENLKKTCEQGR